jgi:spermidine/putrescine transport system substrate-binding protein
MERVPVNASRFTRRQFMAGSTALGALVLAGCASESGTAAPSTNAKLRILNWSDYIDDATVDLFAKDSGLDVQYDPSYEDNNKTWTDLFEPNLSRGRSIGFDITTPTFWLAARLAQNGWLEPIARELVPNHVNLDPGFLTVGWDRGARVQMPWQSGLTGIAYNPALTGREIRSLTDLFDARYKGKVGLVTEMRETVPLTMLLQGGDPSRPTMDGALAALDKLDAATKSGQILRYTGNEFKAALSNNEFALCLAWSGDIVQLQQDRPDIKFVIPDEGGMRWFDSMVIPRGAANARGAAEWMNYVYDPANAARITAAVQYVSPVLGVREELQRLGGNAAALADNPILFPTDAIKRRLYTWGGLDAADEDQLETRFAALTG